MNRILFEAREVGSGGDVLLRDYRAKHIVRVLRAVPGDSVRVGIIDGPQGVAEVTALEADGGVRLACRFAEAPPPVPSINLLLALPRPKVMRRLWAPLASLGINNILLTNAEKVERNYFATHWLNPATYRPLLIEGLQQSGDTRLPKVQIFRRFRPLIEDRLDTILPDSLRLVGHPREAQQLSSLDIDYDREVLLAIGPEGGWSDFEINLLSNHNFQSVSLGWRVLRSDTACIAMIAAVKARTDAVCDVEGGA